MTATPRPASTVVLVRDRPPLEVFLVRRGDGMAFMGGAHVFPGGSVDGADCLDDAELICAGAAASAARMRDVSPAEAIAFHVAAIRELFEEAGVLLARRDGALIAADEHLAARLRVYRRQLAAGERSIADVARRESVRLALDALAYFAHWVTPEIDSRRFDTRFFIAVAPQGQEATHDASETTHGEWIAPAEAIARCKRGDIALPPPTWTTLRQIERFDTSGDVMRWARACAVPRVQPTVVQQGDRRLVLLPGDPECAPLPGFECSERRFSLDGRRWLPVAPE